MAFITNSVGSGGKNSPPDVSVIQWMLIRAQKNYGLNLFDITYVLSETGSLDSQTSSAVQAIIKYRKSGSGFSMSASKQTNSVFFQQSWLFPDAVIMPDDENYKFLLECSLAPICLIPATRTKIDFFTDPLVTQALGGKLTFAAFKTAAESKDGTACETNEPKGQNQPAILFASYKDSSVRITSSEVVEKLTKIAADYHNATGSTLTLTDGDRTALEQADRMIKQIRIGELGLYTQIDARNEVKKVYDAGRAAGKTDDQIAQDIGKVIQNQIDTQGVYLSRHLRNRAADVRSRSMNAKQLSAFKKAAQDNGATILKEGDHLHLQF